MNLSAKLFTFLSFSKLFLTCKADMAIWGFDLLEFRKNHLKESFTSWIGYAESAF